MYDMFKRCNFKPHFSTDVFVRLQNMAIELNKDFEGSFRSVILCCFSSFRVGLLFPVLYFYFYPSLKCLFN